jgi:hypothetical protein
MIWIRRALTVPLGLLLFALLLAGLVIAQVNGTFLNPDYYVGELRNADVYEFLLVDVATTALDEAQALNGEALPEALGQNPLAALGLSTDEVVASLNRAVPPEWLQSSVEDALHEVGGYVAGRRDEFEITIQPADRVAALASEAKTLLRESNAYELLFDELVAPAVADAAAREMPLGLDVTSDQLVSAAKRVIPKDWMHDQIEAAIDELTPYLLNGQDGFELRVELSDRARLVPQEIKRLLSEANAYDTLYNEVIEAVLRDNIGESISLPLGIVITDDEVVEALRRVAPPSWVQTQAERVIDDAAPYLMGESDSFAISISLVENKLEAQKVIEETSVRKLNELVDRIPRCRPGQSMGQIVSGETVRLPECIPSEVPVEQVINLLSGPITREVNRAFLDLIPDNLTFTQVDLREALVQSGSEESLDLLDDIRRVIKDGWTYTDKDLREDLQKTFANGGEGDDVVRAFDSARKFLSEGWTYTQDDLREDLAESGDGSALATLDRARNAFKLLRRLNPLIFLGAALALAAIGFLGGRTWPSRVAWAAAFLVGTSVVIVVLFGMVYDRIVEPMVVDARLEALADIGRDGGQFEETRQLVVGKVFEIAEHVVGGFGSGVAAKAAITLALGLIALGVALGWPYLRPYVAARMVRRSPP